MGAVNEENGYACEKWERNFPLQKFCGGVYDKKQSKKKVIFGYILMLLGAMLPLYIFTSISVHNVMGTHEFERFWKEQSLLSEGRKEKA